MTGADPAEGTIRGDGAVAEHVRRTRLRTLHADAEAAATIAAALRPDDTESMSTRADGDAVRTEIERGTTGGLHSTVDDYVVNLTVAETVVESAREHNRQHNDNE